MDITRLCQFPVGCCKKLGQTQWLKTIHIYYPTVLEVGILIWVHRAVFLLEALGQMSFPCLLSPASTGHLYSLAHGPSLHLHGQQSSISLLSDLYFFFFHFSFFIFSFFVFSFLIIIIFCLLSSFPRDTMHSMQDLSSLTRDQTRAPCSGSVES